MTPGLQAAAAIVTGVAAGVVGVVQTGTALALAIALGSGAIAIAGRRLRQTLVVAALGFAASGYGANARTRVLNAPLRSMVAVQPADPRDAEPVMVTGVLTADAAQTDAGIRLLIRLTRLRVGSGWKAVGGRIQVHVAGDLAGPYVESWTAGRQVTAPVVLRGPAVLRNPGGPSESRQALRRPFDLSGTVKSAALVSITPGPWWHELPAAVRRYVRDVSRRYVAPVAPESAAIVTAILIGDRAGLSDAVERRLQAAGTYHVIAISGGNVALLTTMCFLILRGTVRSHRVVAGATMATVIAYGWTVGGEPSVQRAVIAACLYLSLDAIGLSSAPVNLLALVAVIVAIADPLTVVDVGAWLSFGATLGIVLFTGRLVRRATPRAWGDAPAGRIRRFIRLTVRAAIGLLAATLAAELALLPISATVFSRASAAGLLLNFVAIPAMAVVQLAGLVAVVFSWWDAVASLAGAIAAMAAVCLVRSADLVDLAPWLSWRVPPMPIGWTIAFYAAAGVAIARRCSPRLRRVAAAAVAVSAVVLAWAPHHASWRPPLGWLRVSMLDVGQGDAVFVQLPSGHSLLVDAGGAARGADVGGRIVTPSIWALGVRELDWLLVTHADLDHIGGAPAVATDLHPREIWEGIPVARNLERRQLRAVADERALAWRRLTAGHAFEAAGLVVDVLNPFAPDWERQRVRNDDSVVMRLRFGGVEFLLTGDAGAEFENRFVPTDPAPPIRILKVGHHGSRTSSSARFLNAYQPHIALVSVGQGNLFGHPAPEVLGRLQALDATIFRTDRDGAVVLETDGRLVRVTTMSGRQWTLIVTSDAP